MTPAPDALALLTRMAQLDRTIATAQAEQAAIWNALGRMGHARPVGVAAILDAVAAEFRVPRAELLVDRRNAQLCAARHAACWLARHMTTLSFPAIARLMRRDHTTIIHSVQAAELRIGRDGTFAHQIATLQAELAGRLAQPEPREEAA